jgi:undecaprenyl-diphosphatase
MLFLGTFVFLEVFLEAFPISSSGHALFLSYLLEQYGAHESFSYAYSLVNHLGHGPIACAVIFFFLCRYIKAIKHVRLWLPIVIKLCAFGFVCDALTGLLYSFHPQFSIHLLPYGFAFTATVLRATGAKHYSASHVPAFVRAILFGISQAGALFPGVSRLGMTYACARFFGIRSYRAFQLSFALGLPVNIAGFAKGIYDAHKVHLLTKLLNREMLIVMIVSAFLLCINLKIMEYIARRDAVWKFSWYLYAVAICAWLLM